MEQVWYAFPRRSVGTRERGNKSTARKYAIGIGIAIGIEKSIAIPIPIAIPIFLVSKLLLGNVYLCDEHFISSGFGEVTAQQGVHGVLT